MISRAYFAKWFEAASIYLPATMQNFGERLLKDPIPFAVSTLYDRSFENDIAISYPAWPFQSSPTLVVVSGSMQNMLAVTSYGDGEKLDDASRQPLGFIKEMAGTDNIINLTGAASIDQRKKIKPFLTERASLDKVFADSRKIFDGLFDHWDTSISLRDNVGYVCTSLIAKCVLGIPMLTREQAGVVIKAGNLLRESEPGKPDFVAGEEALAKLNDDLLTLHKDVLLSDKNYIHAKAAIATSDSETEKFAKLLATRGVSNLLVESNLTMLLMTGIGYVNQSPEIKKRLLDEINSHPDMTLESMRKLSYLDCTYKEALRFSSPTPIIIRATSKPADLAITDQQGRQKIYRASAHALLFAPIRRMHHDTCYWKNPETFNPERFEDPEAIKHFMPFSLGTRTCPAASHFNEIIFKTALLASVKYDLQFDKEFERIPADSLTSRWKQEYYVTKIEESLQQREKNRL